MSCVLNSLLHVPTKGIFIKIKNLTNSVTTPPPSQNRKFRPRPTEKKKIFLV